MIINRIIHRIQREINLQLNQIKTWKVKRSLPRQLDFGGTHPIIIFNASTRLSGLSQNAGFSLITSLALQKNKIPVHHVFCNRGLRPCVLGTDRYDPIKLPPCAECTRTSRLIYRGTNLHSFSFNEDKEIDAAIQGLNLSQLLNFSYQSIPLGKMVLPSMRWILRRHHLEDNKNNRLLAQRYIQSAWGVFQEFSDLIDTLHPQAVIVFNGMFYPEAMARLAAHKKEVPVISHEVGMLPLSAFFTYKEATAYPVNIDGNFRLSEEQNARLDAYLKKRFQGKFQTAGVKFWPEIQHFSPDLLERMGKYKEMIPVFTNVIFDTSQSHANSLFEHMFRWLDLVIEEVKKHPKTLFVIRAHPDEVRPGKESRESVAEWVADNNLEDIPNIVFIPPGEFISSYELITAAKFVMVYNSTIGLEASIMGKPVLCAGKARYTQIPTVFFPDSKAAYTQQLEKLLRARLIDHPNKMKENARRVLYSQLFRASLPFNEFLEEDGIWRGYVRLRNFSPDKLLWGHTEVIDVVLDGILKGKNFIREI